MLRREDVAGVTAQEGGQLTGTEGTFVWCFSASPGEESPQPNNWWIPQASTFGIKVDQSSEGSQFSRKASLCSHEEDLCWESANSYSFHVSCSPGVSFPCWTQTCTIHSHCWEIKHLNYKFRAGTKRTLTLRVYSDIQTMCVWAGILCDCGVFVVQFSSVQFSPVTQSCPTLGDPMNHSTPGLPVHHQLPEFTQTHVHRVSDAIQPSHPLSSPSPPAPSPSQHWGLFPMSQLFASGGQSIGVSALASVLSMNTQDWSPLGWTCWASLQSKGLSRVFSNTTVQKHQFFGTQLSSQISKSITSQQTLVDFVCVCVCVCVLLILFPSHWLICKIE